MPWNKRDYPDSFNHLHKDVRNKAIDIANALLKDVEPFQLQQKKQENR